MQQAVRRLYRWVRERAAERHVVAEQITARRLVVVDEQGRARIVAEVVDDVAMVRVVARPHSLRGATDVVLHAVGTVDDDPPTAGISLRSEGSEVDTWEVRRTL